MFGDIRDGDTLLIGFGPGSTCTGSAIGWLRGVNP